MGVKPSRNKKSALSRALMPQASALQRKGPAVAEPGDSSFFDLRILPDFSIESPFYEEARWKDVF